MVKKINTLEKLGVVTNKTLFRELIKQFDPKINESAINHSMFSVKEISINIEND
jgi:hypothetical protein